MGVNLHAAYNQPADETAPATGIARPAVPGMSKNQPKYSNWGGIRPPAFNTSISALIPCSHEGQGMITPIWGEMCHSMPHILIRRTRIATIIILLE